MFNECFFGFSDLFGIGNITVFSTMDGFIDSEPNTAELSTEHVVPSASDSSSDIISTVEPSIELPTSSFEESTTVFEESTTDIVEESSTDILDDVTSGNGSLSDNSFFIDGSLSDNSIFFNGSSSDYTSLIEVVSLADKNNVDALNALNYKVNAILFVLLLFWSIDRIKKVVRGFEDNAKHDKFNR